MSRQLAQRALTMRPLFDLLTPRQQAALIRRATQWNG